jgi:hypothetical protein
VLWETWNSYPTDLAHHKWDTERSYSSLDRSSIMVSGSMLTENNSFSSIFPSQVCMHTHTHTHIPHANKNVLGMKKQEVKVRPHLSISSFLKPKLYRKFQLLYHYFFFLFTGKKGNDMIKSMSSNELNKASRTTFIYFSSRLTFLRLLDAWLLPGITWGFAQF